MSDLVRFGVAMERALLVDFDRRIAARGYENRSEALRDLIRADLTRAAWDRGAHVAATLTVVYEEQVRAVVDKLVALDGEHPGVVVASMRVPLGPGRTLEVMAVRGAAAELTDLSGQLSGTKGVLSCELTLAAPLHDPKPRADAPTEPA